MIFDSNHAAWIEAHQQEHFDLLLTMARIPAPSNHEQQRAEFICNWLRNNGGQDAYIDDALNVILPLGVTEEKPLAVFAAHSDIDRKSVV